MLNLRPMEILEYNKKISKFMKTNTAYSGYIVDNDNNIKAINFDSSWDLLMMVFHKMKNLKISNFEPSLIGERIFDYTFHYEINDDKCHIYYIRKGVIGIEKTSIYYVRLDNENDDMLTICFEAIIKFIDWYLEKFEQKIVA